MISRRRAGAPLGLVTVAAAGSVALASCASGSSSAVTVEPAAHATVRQTVDVPATVAPKASGSVTATAAGTVAELRVRDGQQVKAGAVLLRLLSPSAQRQLREARAAAAQAAQPASPGTVDSTPGSSGPGLDIGAAQRQLTDAEAAAQRALDTADTAARQLPAGPQRAQASSGVAQLRASLATSRAAAASALTQLTTGVSALTGQLAGVSSQLQTAVSALGLARREQAQAAVRAAQSAVDGLTVRAPVSGTVQLGTGTAPAGAASGAGLTDLLAQLPASVTSQLGRAGAGAGGPPGGGTPGGTTSTAPVGEGSPVSAAGLLATVFDTSSLTLDAAVDETEVLAVRAGVGADVALDAVPGAHYRGAVTSVETATTSSARGGVSYRVHLSLGPGTRADGTAAPKPRPGMSAVASLAVRTDRDAVAVPAAAVVRDGERDTLWVVESGRAVRRPVVLGAQGNDAVAVQTGLAQGERVVTRGADGVHAGQQLP